MTPAVPRLIGSRAPVCPPIPAHFVSASLPDRVQGISMFRWKTPVMTGQWCRSHMSALADALRAGQAEMINSEILLFDFVRIEQKGHEPTTCELQQQLAA